MASTVPTIKGRDNILKHFTSTKCCWWKLYNAMDQKSPIMLFTDGKSVPDGIAALTECIDNIDPNGIYNLDTFKPSTNDSKEKSFIRPETSVCFSLNDNQVQIQRPINSTQEKTAIYTPEFGEHIKLITDNARIKAEYDVCSLKLKEALEANSKLENDNKILQDLLDSEEEEEEEEEESESIGAMSAKDQLMLACVGLIKDKGSLIVENLMGLKNTNPVQPAQPAMNGTNEENQAFINVCMELKKYDPELLTHLVKLRLIAEQMPDTFKMILDSLNQIK